MILVDSHCHFHLMDLDKKNTGFTEEIALAKEKCVKHFLCVATHLNQHEQLIKMAEQYASVKISTGLHPNETSDEEPTQEDYLRLAKDKHVVAIGETGLDYYRTDAKLLQQKRFENQIQVSKALNKPLIIHTRQAKDDTLGILKNQAANEVGGVFHCFTEDWAMAKAGIDLGFKISFSGIVTFKNAIELQEVAKKVPLDAMLIETDSPYLAPVPMRGKPNRPAYVAYVAEFLADLKGISLEALAEKTTENYLSLFKISM